MQEGCEFQRPKNRLASDFGGQFYVVTIDDEVSNRLMAFFTRIYPLKIALAWYDCNRETILR